MRCLPHRASALALLVMLGWPVPAGAQAADRTAAEALFDRGRELMQAGDYEQACPKLAESQRLDPAVGTLLNLGLCYEKSGRTASAWAAFREAEALARSAQQPERARVARERADALKPQLVTLTIRVPEAARVEGLEVVLDGEPLREPMWGMPTPVDPGTYSVEARAPGHRTWTKEATVAVGRSVEVAVEPLTPTAGSPPKTEAASAPPATTAAAPYAGKQTTEPHDSGVSDAGSGYRTAALVAAGVGLVGVGLGSYFGLVAQSKNDDSMAECRTSTLCDPGGVDLRDEAFQAATLSTVAFAVGVAGLATGTVLWLAAPEADSASARGTRRGVLVSVGGRF